MTALLKIPKNIIKGTIGAFSPSKPEFQGPSGEISSGEILNAPTPGDVNVDEILKKLKQGRGRITTIFAGKSALSPTDATGTAKQLLGS